MERIIQTRYSRSDSSRSVQLLGQTGLFPVGGIFMNDTLGRGLVDHGGSCGQLGLSILRIFSDRSFELADRCTHTALHDTIAKILLLADLDAFLGGLDIRQLGSPPLRILKKPSLGMLSCLLLFCNPYCKKMCVNRSSIPVQSVI